MATAPDVVDLHEPLVQLAERFAFDARNIARIDIEPDRITFHVFASRNGKPYVDEATNTPAMACLTARIRS